MEEGNDFRFFFNVKYFLLHRIRVNVVFIRMFMKGLPISVAVELTWHKLTEKSVRNEKRL